MKRLPSVIRAIVLVLTLQYAPASCWAQEISGTFAAPELHGEKLKLFVSRGTTQRLVDSTVIDRMGRFSFAVRRWPRGFYHLAVHDSDQVDIILAPDEKRVELNFSGTPLQRHIRVIRGDESKRLWEYKLVSKEAQAVQASVTAQKRALNADDHAGMLALDSVIGRAIALQQEHLRGLREGYPKSFLSKVIIADRGVTDAERGNAQAVLDVFDFSDPELMRSSVYDKAVLTFLRNLHIAAEEQLISATDSLLVYAGGDTTTEAYMLDHLITTFATYGPELVLQHVIDRYVISQEGLKRVDPELRGRVQELLKVAVGAVGPDVEIPTRPSPTPLSELVAKNELTLLFFYSSTCDHCLQQIEGLKPLHANVGPKGFDIIGIALDTDTTEFQQTLTERNVPWACHSEFNGWGSRSAKAYKVQATPFLFLLDPSRRIVAKPSDAEELGRVLMDRLGH